MKWWEIVALIIGPGGFVALISLLVERLKRKDTVQDRRQDAAAQIQELREETSEQFGQVDSRIERIEGKVDSVAKNTEAVMVSTKAQAYDRIRHLGMQYIKAGEISPEELENLMDMHAAYKKLGGDGFLDKVMETVGNLRLVQRD